MSAAMCYIMAAVIFTAPILYALLPSLLRELRG